MKRALMRGAAIAVGGGFAIGAAAAVLGISPAHAETHVYGIEGDRSAVGYAMELEQDGWVMTPAQARQNAANICGQHALGFTRSQLIRGFEQGGQSFDIAFDLVWGAEFHFCPAYVGTNT